MRIYNVVTNQKIINVIKKSKYFKINLGMAITMPDKNGDRILSDKDLFAASYNYQYKTTIYSQGNIGDIHFYIDHYIHDDKLAFYYDLEEFVFDYDNKFIIEKGLDSYIGYLLKNVDDRYELQKNQQKNQQEEVIKTGSPDKLVKSPGSVLYSDIKSYLQEKRDKNL